MANNPILITPTIDGRNTMVGLKRKGIRGVRDKLEGETLAYAHGIADIIRGIKKSDGFNIEVVVPNFTVGGLADLAKLQDFADDHKATFTNMYASPCWCYPDEVADYLTFRIQALVGKPGLDRPGMVWEGAADAGFVQRGIPVFKIPVEDLQIATDNTITDPILSTIVNFATCATAVNSFYRTNYLDTGDSMGIPGAEDQRRQLLSYWGMGQKHVDMGEITARIKHGIYNREEYETIALPWKDDNIRIGRDDNPLEDQWTGEEKRVQLEQNILATMIMRDMMLGNPDLPPEFSEHAKGYNASCAGFANQRHWSDYNTAGIIDSILPSTFDWNGRREPITVATENDVPQALIMRLGTLITGGAASLFHDHRSPWTPESVKKMTGEELPEFYETPWGKKIYMGTGVIDARNSGDAALDGTGKQRDGNGRPTLKPWYDVTDEEVQACLAATEFCPVIREYFNGGGNSVKYQTEGGIPFTAVRLYYTDSKPRAQVSEGWSVDLGGLGVKIADMTNGTWPGSTFVPNVSPEGDYGEEFKSMINSFNAWRTNHVVMIPGHCGDDVITALSMLRIPTPMHNISKDRLLRPSIWQAEGAMYSPSGDVALCDKLGPLYLRS